MRKGQKTHHVLNSIKGIGDVVLLNLNLNYEKLHLKYLQKLYPISLKLHQFCIFKQ